MRYGLKGLFKFEILLNIKGERSCMVLWLVVITNKGYIRDRS
jgi:hypothetical protein